MAVEALQAGTSIQANTAIASGITATNSYVAVTGGDLNAAGMSLVSYILIAATQNAKFQVYAATLSDFSDEATVGAEITVTAGVNKAWPVCDTDPNLGLAFFPYYRIKAKNAVADVVSTVGVSGLAR